MTHSTSPGAASEFDLKAWQTEQKRMLMSAAVGMRKADRPINSMKSLLCRLGFHDKSTWERYGSWWLQRCERCYKYSGKKRPYAFSIFAALLLVVLCGCAQPSLLPQSTELPPCEYIDATVLGEPVKAMQRGDLPHFNCQP